MIIKQKKAIFLDMTRCKPVKNGRLSYKLIRMILLRKKIFVYRENWQNSEMSSLKTMPKKFKFPFSKFKNVLVFNNH